MLITYILLATTAVLWGANFNLAPPVVAEMHPFVAGASRYLLAAAIMLALTWLRKESVPIRHWRSYLILGIVGVFGFNLLFFLGMASTSAVNGALIMALNPLFTSLIAFFLLKEQLSARQWFAFPIGLIGVAIVVLGAGAHLEVSRGDWFLLAGCLSWAFYNVFVKMFMPKDTSGIANTAGIMTVGALALTAVAILADKPFVQPSLPAGLALIAMAVGGGVLAYLFWNAGISKIGAGRAAIFLNLVPVASMIIAAFEGMPPNHAQLIGGALVIGAVSFASIQSQPQPQQLPDVKKPLS